jgi:hypothetical protein
MQSNSKGTMILKPILSILPLILSVMPPASLPGIPEQVGRNGFYYQQVDQSWLPATILFGPWENLDFATEGYKKRPISFRVGIVCGGKSLHCDTIESYVEVKLLTYGPEYANHSQDLVLVDKQDQKMFKPYSGTYGISQNLGLTTDLPKNWIPNDPDSPQLPVVGYISGGEFVLTDMKAFLSDRLSRVYIGEWVGELDDAQPKLLNDLQTLIREARPVGSRSKGR